MMATTKMVPAIRFNGFEDKWEGKKLGEIGDIVGGGTPSTSNKEFWDGSIDWYSPTEIGDHVYANGSNRKITQIGLEKSSATILPANRTVLFTSRAGIGDMAILKNQGATNQGFQSLVLNEDSNTYFIYSMGFLIKKFALKYSSGSTFLEISGKALGKMPITIPKPTEQIQIGNYFKELDNLIQLQEQKLEKVTNLKKAMLEKMFPKEGADVPEVRFKGFTKKWEKKKLEEVVNISSALRVHKNEWTTSGVPFFRSSDVVSSYKGKENTKAYISSELYLKLSSISGAVKKDDILITGGGSIGIPYLIKSDNPLYFKDADLLWIKNINSINGYFLYTFFLTQVFRSYIESITHIGTISHYTIEQAKCTPAAIPDPVEQQKIGEYFQKLDQLISQFQQKIRQLKYLKQALLQKMFI